MPAAIATSIIARQAARLLEQSDLSHFGEDTPLAVAMAEMYPVALDKLLEMYDWEFASRLADLAEVVLGPGDVADVDFPHSFKLPADSVRLIAVKPDTVAWRADEKYVRADQATTLRIRYTRRTNQENLLPGLFRDAVAYDLAAMLGPQFLRTSRRVDGLRREAEASLAKARKSLARMASSRRYDGLPEQPDWVGAAIR